MNQIELSNYIHGLIERDEMWKFYKSKEWMQLKESILQKYHHECQECKRMGILKTHEEDKNGNMVWISTVHHINHVRDCPELALSEYYYDIDGNRQRNLIPVCKACHNKLHPEKRKASVFQRKHKLISEERW